MLVCTPAVCQDPAAKRHVVKDDFLQGLPVSLLALNHENISGLPAYATEDPGLSPSRNSAAIVLPTLHPLLLQIIYAPTNEIWLQWHQCCAEPSRGSPGEKIGLGVAVLCCRFKSSDVVQVGNTDAGPGGSLGQSEGVGVESEFERLCPSILNTYKVIKFFILFLNYFANIAFPWLLHQ